MAFGIPTDGTRMTEAGERLEEHLYDIGFDAVWAQAGADDLPADTQEAFLTYGAAVAVSDTLEDAGMEPWETGGWSVFTHLLDAEGADAVARWRGSDDTDKDVFLTGPVTDPAAAGDAINDRYGGDDPIVQRSTLDEQYDGAKYVGDFPVTTHHTVDMDVLVRDTDPDAVYSEARTATVGDATLRVPAKRDVLASKLTAYNDDPSRAKDRDDVATLLYLAEQEDGTDSIPQLFDSLTAASGPSDQYNDFGTPIDDLGDMLQEVAGHIAGNRRRSDDAYAPSDDYLAAVQDYARGGAEPV